MKILCLNDSKSLIFQNLSLSNTTHLQFYHEDIEAQNLIHTIHQINPQLTLADTSNELIDEFTFVQNFNNQFPDIKLVIITPSDQINYIRALFKSGIYDFIRTDLLNKQYVLSLCQELQDKSLPSLNTAGTSLLKSDTTDKCEELLYQLIKKGKTDFDQLKPYLDSLKISVTYKKFFLLIIENDYNIYQKNFQELSFMKECISSCIPAPYQYVTLIYNNQTFIALIGSPHIVSEADAVSDMIHAAQNMVIQLAKKYYTTATIGMSDLHSNLKHIPQAFHECETALFNQTYNGTGHVYYYSFRNSSIDASAPYYLLDNFESILNDSEFSLTNAQKALDFFFLTLRNQKPSPARLQTELFQFLSLIYAFCAKNNITFRNICGIEYLESSILNEFHTLDSVQIFFSNCLEHLDIEIQKVSSLSMTQHNIEVSTALEYIHQNYMSSITLKDISSKLRITDSYLCRIFKKSMGVSVITYVNSIRIQHAKRLIATTPLNIGEISQAVGFSSVSYFCNVFHKSEGCTFTEYKHTILQPAYKFQNNPALLD